MEGNGKDNNNNKDGTDNAPIRPVSSLLSHFENLSSRLSPSNNNNGAGSPRDTSPRFLRTPDQGDDNNSRYVAGRASLDLPRSQSPWGVASASLQSEHLPSPPNGRTDSARNGSSPIGRRRGFSRPLSMNLRSSPQLPPTLTVDSPRSPPRGFDAGSDNSNNTSNNNNANNRGTGHHYSRSAVGTSDTASRSTPPRPYGRPLTPSFGYAGSSEGNSDHLLERGNSPVGKAKSASVPPPVNRADKPKILGRGSNLSQADVSALAPTFEQTTSDERVSPFSTPPSSPEKPEIPERRPSRPFLPEAAGKFFKSPSPSRPVTEPPPRPPTAEKPTLPTQSALRDARELGFSRARPVPEPSRDTKPIMKPIPPPSKRCDPPLNRPRDPREFGLAGRSDHPEDRPGLPPRIPATNSRDRGSDIKSRRSLDVPRNNDQPSPSPSRRLSAIDTNGQFPPPPRRDTSGEGQPQSAQSPRPPPVFRETKYTSPSTERYQRSDEYEEEQAPEETPTPVPRTDYPDSSQVNRRPPVLKTGPSVIPTKYDTRVFDVCGRYVCTTGFLTRVWDVTTGELVMSMSHGETVKVLSLAFKPGKGLEDEGKRLWLGTSIGELHEVDISTQSIISSRSYPSRREIIKIYRHKREMWTVDDEGRLLIWPPDESGTPNLQYSYSNPYDRVAKGQTFSMVVGDTLWLATGKEVRVYRPNANNDVGFHVLRRPLGTHHSGDVTSGTFTNKDGGRVYLGHADGKVTIYSSNDYTCLGTVNVSVYKINCLAMVGDHLWAAYKTGMIYVYDINTNPWTVKKDWHAHDSPVVGLLLDPSSVWTVNRLQVTSLGTDNCIRLWDGMLEDDWLEARMQSRDVEYCTFREIRATIVTWNAGASVPGSVRNSSFIRDAIHPEQPPEILVFGFQELVDLENKKITAKSLLMGSKKRDQNDKEHMSRQYRVWRDHLASAINECMPLDESYVLLHTANLVGLFTCVFIKQQERQKIRNISAAEVKRGMGGLHGNKGALILRFVIDDSSLCFVNCHLAAGQTQTAHRNNDIAAILESESLPAENSLTTRADLYVGGGDGTMIMDHEICILNGDLNYRIDSIPRNVIIDDIKNNNLPKLLERDQLLASKRKNPGFRLRSFNEAPITFAPTYKYDVGTDDYDSSEKKRAPAWCDRVLYRGVGRIKQLEYRRHEVRASDHRPVSASFKMRVKTVSPKDRAVIWEECVKEFAKEKRRLASEASIEYLVNVLGIDLQEARSLIANGGK